MIIDTTSWGWPQWVWAILSFLNIILAPMIHGKPKPSGTHNFIVTWVSAAISLWILIAGGFFK